MILPSFNQLYHPWLRRHSGNRRRPNIVAFRQFLQRRALGGTLPGLGLLLRGGYSDLILGAITVNSESDWAWLRKASTELGQYASPDDCWLALRGLRTLGARLRAQSEAAVTIATWFAARPEVARVLHPALPSCPGHEFILRDFSGGCGLFGVVFHPNFPPPRSSQ